MRTPEFNLCWFAAAAVVATDLNPKRLTFHIVDDCSYCRLDVTTRRTIRSALKKCQNGGRQKRKLKWQNGGRQGNRKLGKMEGRREGKETWCQRSQEKRIHNPSLQYRKAKEPTVKLNGLTKKF